MKQLFQKAFLLSGVLALSGIPAMAQNACDITVAEVISFNPTKRRDGSLIPGNLIQSQNVIGTPQDNDGGSINYASLGFGGEIVVRLSGKIADGEGADFRVVETTVNSTTSSNCNRYPERAEVFGSQDGCNFVCLGTICQDANIDLSGSGLEWIQYVKLHDVSPLDHPFNNDMIANGFDFDGIRCLTGAAPADAAVNGTFLSMYPRTAQNYLPANPNTIPLSRRNPELATGAPQGGNGSPITFTSLGFGGEITLVFDYLVFDNEGPDLYVTETSGSSNYPEKAQFYGSSCGNNWVLLDVTEDGPVLEQDGWIDLSGYLYSLKYLRIVDRSRRSQFSGGADGYDVDGVSVINGSNCTSGSTTPVATIARWSAEPSLVPDEALRAEVFPNPFHASASIQLMGSSIDEMVQVRVMTLAGQVVMQRSVNVAAGEQVNLPLDFAGEAGIYLLETSGTFGREVSKLVRQ